MNQALIETILHIIGGTLLHSLWQGVLIAGVIWIALRCAREAAATVRYSIAASGLVLLVLTTAATATWLALPGAVPAELAPAPGASALPVTAAESAGITMTWDQAPALLAILWCAGAVLLQARLVVRWSRAQRLRRVGVHPAPAVWVARFDAMARDLGIGRRVMLATSDLVRVPVQIGVWRPFVLVPVGAWTGLSEAELRAVLAHELAHVRRFDYLINLLQAVAETVLFHHPAAWWISHRVREEREYCCDDLAVTACGERTGLARGLARLALGDACPTAALSSTGGSLVKRIERLTGLRTPTTRRGIATPIAWAAPVVLAASSLLTLSSSTDAAACPPEQRERVAERRVERDTARAEQAALEEVRALRQRLAALEARLVDRDDQRTAIDALTSYEAAMKQRERQTSVESSLRYEDSRAHALRARADLEKQHAALAAKAAEAKQRAAALHAEYADHKAQLEALRAAGRTADAPHAEARFRAAQEKLEREQRALTAERDRIAELMQHVLHDRTAVEHPIRDYTQRVVVEYGDVLRNAAEAEADQRLRETVERRVVDERRRVDERDRRAERDRARQLEREVHAEALRRERSERMQNDQRRRTERRHEERQRDLAAERARRSVPEREVAAEAANEARRAQREAERELARHGAARNEQRAAERAAEAELRRASAAERKARRDDAPSRPADGAAARDLAAELEQARSAQAMAETKLRALMAEIERLRQELDAVRAEAKAGGGKKK